MKKEILLVKNLSVAVGGHTLVHDVSFTLHEGDILAIIGPNGAGKSTVLRALLGLIPYDGEVAWKKPQKIGYVPQRFAFDATFPLTVRELLSLRVRRGGFWFEKKGRAEISAALASVGAGKLVSKRVGALSAGELQRVLLAYALISNPQILFLDEPVAGVDIEGEENFYKLITRLNKEKNITIILVSHDLVIVHKYAAEVICLNKKMICFGPPSKSLTSRVIHEAFGDDVTAFKHNH